MRDLIKFIEFKKKNRRVVLHWYKQDGEDCFLIHTKRLVSFKDRKITSTTNVYGFESLIALHQVIELLTSDSKFIKDTNRMLGAIEKDKWKGSTNCKR